MELLEKETLAVGELIKKVFQITLIIVFFMKIIT